MEVRLKLEITDHDQVLYDSTKSAHVELVPFYDRMLFIQITELIKAHKDDMKLLEWFDELKSKRK